MDAINNKAAAWWRWPLMPLAAICGAMLGTIALAAIMWLGMKFQGGFSEDGWYYRYILPIFTSAMFGYLYAKISFHMAPSGKLIAGTVMVTLLGLLCVLTVVMVWAQAGTSTADAISATVGSAATLVAAISVLCNPDA